jgi:hypothetical protein
MEPGAKWAVFFTRDEKIKKNTDLTGMGKN